MNYIFIIAGIILIIIIYDIFSTKNTINNIVKFAKKNHFQILNQDIYDFISSYHLNYSKIKNNNELIYKILSGKYCNTNIEIYFYWEKIGDTSLAYTFFAFDNDFNNFELYYSRKYLLTDKYIPTMTKLSHKLFPELHKNHIIKSNNHELLEYILNNNFGKVLSQKKANNVNIQILNNKKVIVYYIGLRDKYINKYLELSIQLISILKQDIQNAHSVL